MIEFKDVSYTYFSSYYPLLNFGYTFNNGKYALIGDYDTGNLTLIRLLAKLDTYYKGSILINGEELKKVDFKKFNIAYISLTPTFFNNKSVLYNVAYPLISRKVKKRDAYNIASQQLAKFNFDHLQNAKVKTLDNTQKFILSLIRASVRNIDLLLVEDIFTLDLPNDFDISNYISAPITLLVSKYDLTLNNYTKIYFGK